MANYKILVGPNDLKVVPKLPEDLYEQVYNALSYRIDGYQFTNLYQRGLWDGYKRLFRKNNTAPSGCYKLIFNKIKKCGYDVLIVFSNDIVLNGDGIVHGLTLYELQVLAAKKAIIGRFCIIQAAIRAGKTAIMAKIIASIGDYPTMIITKTDKALVRQTRNKLSELLMKDVGIFSESKFKEKNIVVTSYQALNTVLSKDKRSKSISIRNAKVKNFIKSCKVLLLDECHHVFSEKTRNNLRKFPSVAYKIGLSGTPKPDYIKTVELSSVIGPVVHNIGFQDLINIGRISQPVVIMYGLPRAWYSNYLTEYNDIYDSDIVKNGFRNKFIAQIVENLRKSGNSVYVMVSKIEHGENLRIMIPNSFFISGKIDTSTRERVYKSLQQNKVCVISIPGKEGLDLPKLDAVINAEGYDSSTMVIQKMRSLTAHKDKKKALVIDFIDHGNFLNRSSKRREKIYNSCDGFIVKRRMVPSGHFNGV